MISRNVALVMQQQKTAKLGLTQQDVQTIKEEGVKSWAKEEFGVTDKKALESVYAGIAEASPEIAELEKKPDDDKKKDEKKEEKKSFW
jgi:hypothetical protein